MASRANGGAETYSADMMASLHAAGVEQVAVIPRARSITTGWRRPACGSIPTCSTRRLGLLRRRKLAALIEAFRPDLVHCWMRRAASLVPTLDVPVIGWFGGYYEPANFSPLHPFRRRHAGHRRAHGRARRAAGEGALRADLSHDRGRTHRSSGLTSLLRPMQRCCSPCRGCTRRRGSTSCCGRWPSCRGCVAWIAGDGPLEADLKALAARLGVADRVRFLGWRNDRGALLRAADICVLPSRWEPFGTVMLEAWAAGTPLVAAASQGPAALIEDGANGLLVPVDDAAALAAAIRRLMADPALRAHLIERGQADYQQGFTRAAVTERMLALYRQLIAESGAGSGKVVRERA